MSELVVGTHFGVSVLNMSSDTHTHRPCRVKSRACLKRSLLTRRTSSVSSGVWCCPVPTSSYTGGTRPLLEVSRCRQVAVPATAQAGIRMCLRLVARIDYSAASGRWVAVRCTVEKPPFVRPRRHPRLVHRPRLCEPLRQIGNRLSPSDVHRLI